MNSEDDWRAESPFAPPSRSVLPPAILGALALMVIVFVLTRGDEQPSGQARVTAPMARAPVSEPRQPVAVPAPRPRAQAVEAAPVPEARDHSPTATIYLCVSYAGHRFWSDTVCSQQRATIDRMTTVPGGLPFDQQVALAAQAANEAAPLYAARGAATAGAIGTSPPISMECDALDRELQQIDATTRQPLSASQMDHYRSRRMQVQSRRAALRC